MHVNVYMYMLTIYKYFEYNIVLDQHGMYFYAFQWYMPSALFCRFSTCSSLFIDRIHIHINMHNMDFHLYIHNNRDLAMWLSGGLVSLGQCRTWVWIPLWTSKQRTIFRQVTIFRHLFLISCNFCIFHRNRFISFMPMKSWYIFTQQIKEMAKICFNTLKIVVVKYGEICFPCRNMVLCSTCIFHFVLLAYSVFLAAPLAAYKWNQPWHSSTVIGTCT